MEEFPESPFRVKMEVCDPTSPWKAELGEPGAHSAMAVFGCLIYEINRCANTFNDASIASRASMFDV